MALSDITATVRIRNHEAAQAYLDTIRPGMDRMTRAEAVAAYNAVLRLFNVQIRVDAGSVGKSDWQLLQIPAE